MPIIKTEAERRAYEAFRGITATFSVDVTDVRYRMKRQLATALRETATKHTTDVDRWNAWAEELELDAERMMTDETTS